MKLLSIALLLLAAPVYAGTETVHQTRVQQCWDSQPAQWVGVITVGNQTRQLYSKPITAGCGSTWSVPNSRTYTGPATKY